MQHQKHQVAPNTERHPAAVTSHGHQSPTEYQLDLLHLSPCPLHSTREHRLDVQMGIRPVLRRSTSPTEQVDR